MQNLSQLKESAGLAPVTKVNRAIGNIENYIRTALLKHGEMVEITAEAMGLETSVDIKELLPQIKQQVNDAKYVAKWNKTKRILSIYLV